MQDDLSTRPSPTPSVEEIRLWLAIRERILNQQTIPGPDYGLAERLHAGDTESPQTDADLLRPVLMTQLEGDQGMVALYEMVGRENERPAAVIHADFWRFYNVAQEAMRSHGIEDRASLPETEAVRLEVIRRWLTPERQLENTVALFRVLYRFQVNAIIFANNRQMTRMMNSVVVYGGDGHELPKSKSPEVPDKDTATVDRLSRREREHMDAWARAYVTASVATLGPFIYRIWGETAHEAVKDRLTVEHFVAQAQTPPVA